MNRFLPTCPYECQWNQGLAEYFLIALWSESEKKVKVKLLSRIPLFATPWILAYEAGSSIHEILQARVPEWVAISFSRGSS